MMAADAIRCRRRSAGGGYDGSPHMYWRLWLIQSYETTYPFAFSEVQFREVVGGASASVGGVASASSDAGSSYVAAKAFDGGIYTDWIANPADTPPCWLSYEHSSAISVAEVYMRASNSPGRQDRAPSNFEVQYSDDGINWQTALGVSGEPIWAVGEERTFVL